MQIDRERLARALCLANSGPFIFMDERGKEAIRREVDWVLDDIAAQGFVIVPREPTEAMICAGIAERHDQPVPEAWSMATENIWRAMIEAGKDHTNG